MFNSGKSLVLGVGIPIALALATSGCATKKFVSQQVDELAHTEMPLGEMVTPEAAGFVKERLKDQVQPIVHHLAEIATQENTRRQIGALVKTELNDYYNQLSFFQKFFVSRDKINREVDNLVNKSLPQKVDEFLRGEVLPVKPKVL